MPIPRVMPPAVERALGRVLGFRDRPNPVELYDAVREALPPDPLEYLVEAPSEVGPPVTLAAAMRPEATKIGLPVDGYELGVLARPITAPSP